MQLLTKNLAILLVFIQQTEQLTIIWQQNQQKKKIEEREKWRKMSKER